MSYPYVGRAVSKFASLENYRVVTKTVVNNKVTQVAGPLLSAWLSVQPMPTTEVNRKPEEQRTWQWWTIWAMQEINGTAFTRTPDLKVDDVFLYQNLVLRIKGHGRWTVSGYVEYEAIEDFSGGFTTT